MILTFLINLIHLASRLLVLAVIVDIVLSYFVSPYNQVRVFLDRIVEPLLTPIRRFVPSVQGIDFSPLVLVILIQILEYILVSILQVV